MKLRLGFLSMLIGAAPLAAQEWQSGGAVELVRRAAGNRALRDTDTLLAGWQATARGLVRFVAEVDQGVGPVERLIKADELRVEVYGEGPNRSKQVIVAWRDTTVRPTSIHYHRDHLGIIANDFGPTIRLGEGDEVRDVPHPLSPAGLETYRFRLGDTLTVRSASGTIRVVAVDFRPADPATPGAVGTLALDADRLQLVRAAFTFTAVAYRDATVASITVVLENALQESGVWLPWRQAIAIRRGSTILSLPITTVIRADWTIDDYRFGLRHSPGLFQEPLIAGLQRAGRSSVEFGPWEEILEGGAAPDGELHLARGRAAELLRGELLDGLPRLMLHADGGVSRFLRVNRVQGVTLGGGFRWQLPEGATAEVNGAIGTADGRFTGTARLSRLVGPLRMVMIGDREVRDANPWPRRSVLANSFATLLNGSDAGDWYLTTGLAASLELEGRPWRGAVEVRRQEVAPLESRFAAFDGTMTTNADIEASRAWVVTARGSRRGAGEGGLTFAAEYGSGDREWVRLELTGDWRLPIGLELWTQAGAGSRNLPPHRGFAAGGAGSLTGTVPRAMGGRRLVRIEVSRPVSVGLGLPAGGRYTDAGLGSAVVPFVVVATAGGILEGASWPPSSSEGVTWVAGARLELWGPLLRLEIGWAPARVAVGFAFDAHPDWWSLL